MTNNEKYKDPKERAKKFLEFCANSQFKERFSTSIECAYAWGDIEYKEEELLPCPFCGGEAKLVSSVESWVECKSCGATSQFCACDSGTIEKWNKRV